MSPSLKKEFKIWLINLETFLQLNLQARKRKKGKTKKAVFHFNGILGIKLWSKHLSLEMIEVRSSPEMKMPLQQAGITGR